MITLLINNNTVEKLVIVLRTCQVTYYSLLTILVLISGILSFYYRQGNKPIIFSKICYDNFIKLFNEEQSCSDSLFNQIVYENKFCYGADIIIPDFYKYVINLQ